MNQSLTAYPEYKSAGLPWLAEVPAHWEIKRNKYLFNERDSRSQTGAEELLTVSQYTGITKRADRRKHENELLTNAASLVGYKLVEQYDLVINIMLAWNGSLGISDFNGIVSPAYCVYQPTSTDDPRYFHYLFRSPLYKGMYKAVSTGVVDSRLRLYSDKFFALPALLPPLPEQQRIVAFLDGKTRQIARLLRNKRQLIKLLTEQKQALIHRAVTQGLDPDAPRKDSGVAWLGEVPAHWEVKRLRKVATLNPSKQESISKSELEKRVVFLPMENVSTEGEIDCSQQLPIDQVRNGFTYFRRNDVIVAKITPCFENGKGACVDELTSEFGFGSTEFIVLRAGHELLPSYLYLITASPMFRIMGADNMTGAAGQQRVSTDFIRDFQIGVPTTDEQQAILAFVFSEKKLINQTIARAQREIELIQEYRTRLIADVVTGRVDVRYLADAASGLEVPAEVELDLEDEESEEELLIETEDGRE